MDFQPGQLSDEQIEQIIHRTDVNFRLEKMYFTDEEKDIMRRHLRGEMSEQECLDWSLAFAKGGR